MKKIIKIMTIFICLATTSFTMEDNFLPSEDFASRNTFSIHSTARILGPIWDIDLTVLTDIIDSNLDNPRITDACDKLCTGLDALKSQHLSVSLLLDSLKEKIDSTYRISPQAPIEFHTAAVAAAAAEGLELTIVADFSIRKILKSLQKVSNVDSRIFQTLSTQQSPKDPDLTRLYTNLSSEISILKENNASILQELDDLEDMLEAGDIEVIYEVDEQDQRTRDTNAYASADVLFSTGEAKTPSNERRRTSSVAGDFDLKEVDD